MKPSIGRIIHYRFFNRYNDAVDLPAIITSVNEDEKTVNLQVFGDGTIAETSSSIFPKEDIMEDSGDIHNIGNWHWPEQVGSSGERAPLVK